MKADKLQQYKIRVANFDDVYSLRKMHGKSWLETYPDYAAGISREWVLERVSKWTTPEGIEKSKEHYKHIFGNPDHFYRLIEKNNEVVGLFHASKVNGNQQIEAIYLLESEHGTGIAQKIMNQALEWLDASKPIRIEVASYNYRAVRFYEKFGFSVVKDSEHLFADKIPTIDMIRKGD